MSCVSLLQLTLGIAAFPNATCDMTLRRELRERSRFSRCHTQPPSSDLFSLLSSALRSPLMSGSSKTKRKGSNRMPFDKSGIRTHARRLRRAAPPGRWSPEHSALDRSAILPAAP